MSEEREGGLGKGGGPRKAWGAVGTPEGRLMKLANAFQISRGVQVAARLDLGRHLAGGPRSAAELAEATGTHAPTLERLLRFLADLGVVRELAEEPIAEPDHPAARFGPTPLSERLHLVDNLVQGEEAWAAWGALPEALRTGRPVFEGVHGQPFHDYAAAHPEQQARWAEWNSVLAAAWFPALARALPLQGEETVVDVGGGEGLLLTAVLMLHRRCRGVLVDFPGMVAAAPELLEEAGVEQRCRVVAADALEGVPRGGDVYLLSRVLQNLDDDEARRLLGSCAEALAAGRGQPGGRLLLVEVLMPEPGEPRRGALAGHDLSLLLLWGGRHRRRGEMGELLASAGLEMVAVEEAGVEPAGTGAGLPWQLIEARAV